MKSDKEVINVMLMLDCLRCGGAERQLYELATLMDKSKFYPHMIIYHNIILFDGFQNRNDLTFKLIEKKSKFDLGFIFRMVKYVKENNIKIIHSHMVHTNFWGRIIGFLSGAKVITYMLNTNYHKKWYFLEKMMSWIDSITMVNSEAEKIEYLENLKSNKLMVVRNGIDMDKIPENTINREIPAADGSKRIVIIARITPQKNHFCFIKAIDLVKDKISNLKCEFWGMAREQKYLDSVLNFIKERNLTDIIEYKGVSNDVYNVLYNSDLSVLSSDWEGFPHSAIESLACGVPVISTDIADLRALVIEGETGYLFPKGDHVALAERLVEFFNLSPDKRREMSRKSREHARKNFGVKGMVSKIEEAYEKVLGKKP